MSAITDQNAVFGDNAIGFELCDFLEEAGDVNDTASADEVDAAVGEDSRCWD